MSSTYKKYPTYRYIIAITLIFLLVISVNYLSNRFEDQYHKDINFSSFFKNKMDNFLKNNPKAVNLGGSIGRSLNLPILGFSNGVNMAFDNQDLSENEALMNTLLAINSPNLNTFFVAINPMGLLLNNEWSNVKSRRVFYRTLYSYDGPFLIDRDFSDFIISIFFPLVRADSWSAPIKYLLNKLTGINFPLAPQKNEGSESIVTQEEKNRAVDHLKNTLRRIDQGQYYFSNDVENTKNAVIRMCKKSYDNNKKMILYVPPVTDLYKNITQASKYMALANSSWIQVVKQCQRYNAIVIRFDNDEAFQHRYDFFTDTFHLNGKGALYFSTLFEERLKNLRK